MAPLPVDSTRRFFLHYHTSLLHHTVMVRTTNSVDASAFSTFMNSFLVALSAGLCLVTIDGLEESLQGSTIRNPAVWSGGASYGAGDENPVFRPRQLCFLGRALDGRRARMFIFGWKKNSPNNYRLNTTDDSDIAAAITVLGTNPGAFISISGLATVKYPYADVNFNDYWERKVR
jgi:hypothetical protein